MKKLNQAGFTLAEILVAIIIIGISVSSVLILQKGTFMNSTYTNRRNYASQMIAREIENTRNMVISDSTRFSSLDTTKPDTVLPVENGVNLKWHYGSATLNSVAIPDARTVTMTASWQSGNKKDSIRVISAIAKQF